MIAAGSSPDSAAEEEGDYAGGGDERGAERSEDAGGRGRGPGNFDPEAVFARQDADGNGRLEGDQISERMQDGVAEMDADQDVDTMDDELPEDDAASIEDGKIVDTIADEQVKEAFKEKVRQRNARSIFHEHGFSPDDMEPDFKVKVGTKGK